MTILFGEWFPQGKASVLIDGQFGSTGKGLLAAYLAMTAHRPPEIATTNASANAGHTTVFADGSKMVLYHLPTIGVMSPQALIYLNAGAVIDPRALNEEIEAVDGMHKQRPVRDRLVIHPRAAVIEVEDVLTSSIGLSGGTGHGVSGAIAAKAKRTNLLMQGQEKWRGLVRPINPMVRMHFGAAVSIETPQGIGLGLNSGLEYPKCTSREVSVAQSLADAQIHPSFLGNVFLSLRTFPIRVGNATVTDGHTGVRTVSSGGWYPDQREIEWAEIGVTPEITTVTKRQRRIATFSRMQARYALEATRPDVVFLNFVQYCTRRELRTIVDGLTEDCAVLKLWPIFLYGIGPKHGGHVLDKLADAEEACRS